MTREKAIAYLHECLAAVEGSDFVQWLAEQRELEARVTELAKNARDEATLRRAVEKQRDEYADRLAQAAQARDINASRIKSLEAELAGIKRVRDEVAQQNLVTGMENAHLRGEKMRVIQALEQMRSENTATWQDKAHKLNARLATAEAELATYREVVGGSFADGPPAVTVIRTEELAALRKMAAIVNAVREAVLK